MGRMEVARATVTLDINATATAFEESDHLTFRVTITPTGEESVTIFERPTGRSAERVCLHFDAYEWARFKRAIGLVDEAIKQVEEGGAVFRVAQPTPPEGRG